MVGAPRQYDGPMGKSDRAFLFGALGLWLGVAGSLPDAALWIMPAAALASSPRIAADRLRRLGFGDPYLAAIQGGPGGFQGRLATAGPLAEITERDAAAAQSFERATGRLGTVVQGVGRRGVGAVLPHATTALNQLADMIEGRTPGPGFMGMPARSRATGGAGSFGAAVTYFRSQGYSEAQARGMAAGMGAESQFRPDAQNPTSSAYGIGQWLTPRQRDFKRVMGKDIKGSSWEEQLAFMQWELTNTEKRAGGVIKASKTEWGALSAYVGGFMRPGPGAAGDMVRGQRYLAQNATINIGTIVVNTQATDAKGVAAGVRSAIPNANQGLR